MAHSRKRSRSPVCYLPFLFGLTCMHTAHAPKCSHVVEMHFLTLRSFAGIKPGTTIRDNIFFTFYVFTFFFKMYVLYMCVKSQHTLLLCLLLLFPRIPRQALLRARSRVCFGIIPMFSQETWQKSTWLHMAILQETVFIFG